MKYENEDEQEGEWNDEKKEGFGKYLLNDGRIYLGSFKNGKENGYGKMRFEEGDEYKGQWRDEKQDGFGKCLSKEGRIYLEKCNKTKRNWVWEKEI